MITAYVLIGLAFAFTAFITSSDEIAAMAKFWKISKISAHMAIALVAILAWPLVVAFASRRL